MAENIPKCFFPLGAQCAAGFHKFRAQSCIAKDATLQSGQHVIISLAAKRMRSDLENATEYGN